MILKRLTKSQKDDILKGYRAEETTNQLAIRFDCSTNTINRIVKTLLSTEEYKLLKEKRSKRSKPSFDLPSHEKINNEKTKLESSISLLNDSLSGLLPEKKETFCNEEITEVSFLEFQNSDKLKDDSGLRSDESLINKNVNCENNFEEIPPLEASFDFNTDKRKLDLELIDNKILPEVVYILVDKKVELESQLISELPEWNYLPEDELRREAILLFSNQRSAKRNCSRNQRVIKVPNTSVFNTTKSFLVAKGITRLILDESIIALNN